MLRYLKSLIEDDLFYSKGDLQLTAYCDLDLVGSPDNRRSTLGYEVFLGRCLVS